MAKKYYIEYLKLMDHYKQVNKNLKKFWESYEQNPLFRPERDDKIAEYTRTLLF
jgi:hypothetical protein